jgi:DNA-binding transcriptional LysR family regulator
VFLEHARAALVASEAGIAGARQSLLPDADQLVLGFLGGVGLAEPLLSAFGTAHPEFESIPIATTSLCVFVAESHHLGSRAELRYADIADETYLDQAPGVPGWWVDIWWLTERRGRRPKTGRRTAGTVNESLAGVLSGEVIVVTPTFFAPLIAVSGVRAVPLVDVDAPDVELVYLRGRKTHAITQMAGVARTLRAEAEAH